MKTLNLVDLNKSDIKYQIQKFPDGQQQVKILGETSVSYEPSISWNTINNPIQIKSRLNNFKDLELIICTTKSLRELGVKEIHLYTPYFLGSRSDRKFEEGSNNYLKDVICPIINSLNFESVTVLDPHSDVLEACIKGFRKESNISLINFTINSLIPHHPVESKLIPHALSQRFILVSPDAGASKKIYKLAEQIGYKGDVITCSKERNTEGKLTRIIVPIKMELGNQKQFKKDFIIVDDICDEGAAFINIAKEIKNSQFKTSKIYLIVTHGIFSKGFTELNKYFDGIYCTNSYQESPDFKGNNLRPVNLLKQLNLF